MAVRISAESHSRFLHTEVMRKESKGHRCIFRTVLCETGHTICNEKKEKFEKFLDKPKILC